MATIHPAAFSRDSQFAREVQDRMFPSARPPIPNLDYYSDWRRARPVSSDYLDNFEVDEGNLCLAIGDVGIAADVAGKGLRPALLTASLHSIVRALRFSSAASLSHFVPAVDELFKGVCPDNCYATLFVCRYDPIGGRLHYVNAGHEPPFVLRKSGQRYRIIRMEGSGPAIGMLSRPQYHERTIELLPGDLLVAYTDGLCEATNPQGDEWGWRRFVEAVQSSEGRRARDVVEHVMEAEARFADGAPQHDDMTLWIGRTDDAGRRLVLRFAESEEPVAA